MKHTTVEPKNKTGLMYSPHADEMKEVPALTNATGSATQTAANKLRLEYAESGEIGSMVEPLKKSAKSKSTQSQKPVLLDKLGARLAFEASGTRLYDALLLKFKADETWNGGPTLEKLKHFRKEEHEHFKLCKEIIESLGADPTVVSPTAEVEGTASEGIVKVLSDPRTTLLQCLEAMMTAELTDNECWSNLLQLAEEEGLTEYSEKIQTAFEEERDHLVTMRKWIQSGTAEKQATG